MTGVNNYNITFVVLLFILTGCSIKKHQYTRTEIVKDSTNFTVDTVYKSKDVEFEIEEEQESGSGQLFFTEEAYNRYIDSLFAKIDSNINTQQISQAIIKAQGLLNSDTSFLETSFAKSQAVVSNGELYHYLFQKDTILKKRYDSLVQIIEKEREIWHSKEIRESSETVKRSGFNIRIILLLVGIALIGWVLIKRFI